MRTGLSAALLCTYSGKTWPRSGAWRSPSSVQGLGVGRRLVEACWESARELEIKSIFALTNAVGFFERCGYHRIDKSELPQRIWNECVRCPSFPNCQEIALFVLDRARAGERSPARRDLAAARDLSSARTRTMTERLHAARRLIQTIGLRCGNAEGASRSTSGRSRGQPGHRGLDAGDRAQMAIGWDEGYTLGREARLRDWFRGLAIRLGSRRSGAPARGPGAGSGPTRNPAARAGPARFTRSSFSSTATSGVVLAVRARRAHGHPPFYALLGLVGDILAPSWQDLPRARLGPILLFSLTAGAIFAFRRVAMGPLAGGARGG